MDISFLKKLGIEEENSGVCAGGKWLAGDGDVLESINPTTGEKIASVRQASAEEYEQVVQAAQEAFKVWRNLPAPKRGEIIRELRNELAKYKKELGMLVSLEVGKIIAEGQGELQEAIDMADYAVGLSRVFEGKVLPSERPEHHMYEVWHPLGPIGIITAFNFPIAVWSWNALIAAICGDTMIWKPSNEAPLTAIATQHICNRVFQKHGFAGVCNLMIGPSQDIGEKMTADRRLPLISATGSCTMGKRVGEVVSARFGKSLLELGGNNAIIVMDDANLDTAIQSILFGAVGTAGQRCTTTRRIIAHKKIKEELVSRLVEAYKQIAIGDPLDTNTLMGPLINEKAVQTMMDALGQIKKEGGKILVGGEKLNREGFFVTPAIVDAPKNMPMLEKETFAPILYILECENLEEAIAMNNSVSQGLSSALFTNNVQSEHTFLSAEGSDCGIANINIGTSGAEIGGAFGGEKETGGGREAGSDSWKAYMRRQTVTVNYSKKPPALSQGINFQIKKKK